MNTSTNNVLQEFREDKRSGVVHIAMLSAYAIGIHVIEGMIPKPLPWLRFGFTNIITLTTLILYGLKAGMTVTLIRVIVGSLYAGTFLGPAFFLSLAGGASSTLAMWSAKIISGRLLSPVGLSLIGAFVHNIAQLFVAYLFFIQKIEAVLYISPVIILIGTVTGCINGFVTVLVVKKMAKTGEPGRAPAEPF